MHKHRLKAYHTSPYRHKFYAWVVCRHCPYWVCYRRSDFHIMQRGHSAFAEWVER